MPLYKLRVVLLTVVMLNVVVTQEKFKNQMVFITFTNKNVFVYKSELFLKIRKFWTINYLSNIFIFLFKIFTVYLY
jgi:hypothetical protein